MQRTSLLALISFIAIGILVLTVSGTSPEPKDSEGKMNINELRIELGDTLPEYLYPNYTAEQARMGEEIVKYGQARKEDGKMSKVVSIYYDCTHCHNLVQEDPVLTVSDPNARLGYAVENDLPFLQGSTLWGVVNRESWYNDDYYLKYGEWVEKARYNLKEAIQLCATQCAQGRPLKEWEMDAVIAYFNTIQITTEDIDLSLEDLASVSSDQDKLELLKSKYLTYSPATFHDVPEVLSEGYSTNPGDPGRGRQVYLHSCQHCHEPHGPSELVLDDSRLSLRLLKRNMHKQNQYSLYYLLRIGTYSVPGHKPYMPHYTLERMSDQQVEDLRSYIEQAS